MKYKPLFFILVLVALLTAACSATATPTATATEPAAATPTVPPASATPTEGVKGSGDPTWDRIQSTGKIVFGTSADYKPFEFYDTNTNLDGFDIAVARNLGTRLGLQIEFKDYAFEGLGTGLKTGDLDAAIAAISMTPNRMAEVDFSDVYFFDQDAVLARQGSGIPEITSAVQMVGYRVGVQRGSTYDAFLQKVLVNTGLMPDANLLRYEKPEDAVRDLKNSQNDLVFMGALPADEYVTGGGVEIVGKSLDRQLYAIALPKGSTVLRDQINKALSDIRADGTLAQLANTYLGIDISQIPGQPTPMPPAVTPTPGPCYDSMAYVADLTFPDWTVVQPGQTFTKSWRINNNGTCPWNTSYRLVFVQGYSPMGTDPVAVNGTVNPGSNYDISVNQTAPAAPGYYQSYWQMVNANNVAFGPRIWVAVTVSGTPQPSPSITPSATFAPPTATVAGPTPTPPPATPTVPLPTPTIPPATPTLSPPTPTATLTPSGSQATATLPVKPVISSFTATPASVAQGGTIVVSWSFSGDSLAAARLARTDPDGTVIPLNGGADVASTGTLNDPALNIGTVIYTLVVSNEFGGTSTMSAAVTVTGP